MLWVAFSLGGLLTIDVAEVVYQLLVLHLTQSISIQHFTILGELSALPWFLTRVGICCLARVRILVLIEPVLICFLLLLNTSIVESGVGLSL